MIILKLALYVIKYSNYTGSDNSIIFNLRKGKRKDEYKDIEEETSLKALKEKDWVEYNTTISELKKLFAWLCLRRTIIKRFNFCTKMLHKVTSNWHIVLMAVEESLILN